MSICVATPIGTIKLNFRENLLTGLEFIQVLSDIDIEYDLLKFNSQSEFTSIQNQTIIQLQEYFLKKRKVFNLAYLISGNEFTKNVIKATVEIPYGSTLSYQEIAKKAGSPRACRAVGSVMRRNLIPIIIPCHRIICSDGSMGNYSGGAEKKRWLLNFETS